MLINNQIFKNKRKLVKVQNKEKAQICNVQVFIVNFISHEIWEQKTYQIASVKTRVHHLTWADDVTNWTTEMYNESHRQLFQFDGKIWS